MVKETLSYDYIKDLFKIRRFFWEYRWGQEQRKHKGPCERKAAKSELVKAR